MAPPTDRLQTPQTSLRRLAIQTHAASRPERRPNLDQETSSADMSPISMHSQRSVDTTGLQEEDELLPDQQTQARHTTHHGSGIDPPPLYSPEPTETDRLIANPEQSSSALANQPAYGTAGQQQTYYSFPHTAPGTPGEPVLTRGDFFPSEERNVRRRRCRCCGLCDAPTNGRPRWKRILLALCTAMAIALLIIMLYQMVVGFHKHMSVDPSGQQLTRARDAGSRRSPIGGSTTRGGRRQRRGSRRSR